MLKACVLVILKFVFSDALFDSIYRNDNRMVYYPDQVANYFGYSVLLSDMGLHVGAPKAKNRYDGKLNTGLVFACPFDKLRMNFGKSSENNASCTPVESRISRSNYFKSFLRDDMWFGATIGAVRNEILFVCAPRWAQPYGDTHLLANGACYVYGKTREMALMPFRDKDNQAFKTHGERVEYGEYGTHLNFYAYAQAGMSLKVTNDDNIILGAPGMLQWTGGTVEYQRREGISISFRRQPVANPFYTTDLGPDDYFGYSVESGVFEENGTTLHVGGAPRSKTGLGQVLIFEPVQVASDPLRIKYKLIGPQLGAYFGSSLCCTDVNADGRIDLLVGAPNFVNKDSGINYDQGAVFVYLNREVNSSFILEAAGYVSGSEESGARFGTTISSIGDVDGDGFGDVAIAAPWENDGMGVVYIYQGDLNGLKPNYLQRIISEDAKGFGMSISGGYDVDNNYCNDIAIGAHVSGSVYLYGCIPTIKVNTYIKVPNLSELTEGATNFTALFCVKVRPQKWLVNMDFKATKTIDPEMNRALILEDTVTEINLYPGIETCNEDVIFVNITTDLTKPISLQYDLEPLATNSKVRLSEDSTLNSTFLVQMIGDCGKDLICTPWLKMTLEPMDTPYIPGTNEKLGVTVTVWNLEEPAYGIKLQLTLPVIPKRVPTSCSLQNLNMSCDLPAPLHRNESVIYNIELEYEYTEKNTFQQHLKVIAELKEPLYRRNITNDGYKEIELEVTPEANITVIGKSLPNRTVAVSRESFYGAGNVSFVHYYEINNWGPSDWYNLRVYLYLPEKTNLSSKLDDCEVQESRILCIVSLKAKHFVSLVLPLHFDLELYGDYLESTVIFNATSMIEFFTQNHTEDATATTTLVLDPAAPIWPLIVAVVCGLLLLAIIIIIMYKFGFFSRREKEELKRLIENSTTQEEPSSSSSSTVHEKAMDESTLELVDPDSD